MSREIVTGNFRDADELVKDVDSARNMDESGFNLEHTSCRVISQEGQKSINCRVSLSRQNVTAVACVRARGTAMPPMLIIKDKAYKVVHGFSTTLAPPQFIWI